MSSAIRYKIARLQSILLMALCGGCGGQKPLDRPSTATRSQLEARFEVYAKVPGVLAEADSATASAAAPPQGVVYVLPQHMPYSDEFYADSSSSPAVTYVATLLHSEAAELDQRMKPGWNDNARPDPDSRLAAIASPYEFSVILRDLKSALAGGESPKLDEEREIKWAKRVALDTRYLLAIRVVESIAPNIEDGDVQVGTQATLFTPGRIKVAGTLIDVDKAAVVARFEAEAENTEDEFKTEFRGTRNASESTRKSEAKAALLSSLAVNLNTAIERAIYKSLEQALPGLTVKQWKGSSYK